MTLSFFIYKYIIFFFFFKILEFRKNKKKIQAKFSELIDFV